MKLLYLHVKNEQGYRVETTQEIYLKKEKNSASLSLLKTSLSLKSLVHKFLSMYKYMTKYL